MKFDRYMCPHVGCYFAAKFNSHGRKEIAQHRRMVHKDDNSLGYSRPDPKWAYEHE